MDHRGDDVFEILVSNLEAVVARHGDRLVQGQGIPKHDCILHHRQKPKDFFLPLVTFLANEITKRQHVSGSR